MHQTRIWILAAVTVMFVSAGLAIVNPGAAAAHEEPAEKVFSHVNTFAKEETRRVSYTATETQTTTSSVWVPNWVNVQESYQHWIPAHTRQVTRPLIPPLLLRPYPEQVCDHHHTEFGAIPYNCRTEPDPPNYQSTYLATETYPGYYETRTRTVREDRGSWETRYHYDTVQVTRYRDETKWVWADEEDCPATGLYGGDCGLSGRGHSSSGGEYWDGHTGHDGNSNYLDTSYGTNPWIPADPDPHEHCRGNAELHPPNCAEPAATTLPPVTVPPYDPPPGNPPPTTTVPATTVPSCDSDATFTHGLERLTGSAWPGESRTHDGFCDHVHNRCTNAGLPGERGKHAGDVRVSVEQHVERKVHTVYCEHSHPDPDSETGSGNRPNTWYYT